MRRLLLSACGAALLAANYAYGQTPVIDAATLTQATQTASNTASIMQTNQQILDTANKTLQAVTGNRSTGSITSARLAADFQCPALPISVQFWAALR